MNTTKFTKQHHKVLGTLLIFISVIFLTLITQINAKSVEDKVIGTPKNDILRLTNSIISVEGNGGVDIAAFPDKYINYVVNSIYGGFFSVLNIKTNQITILNNIDVLAFSNGTIIGYLKGTSKNDTLNVIPTTRIINGNGGLDTVIFPQNINWYKITSGRNSVNVQDIHGDGTITHLYSISKINFANLNLYDVATKTTSTIDILNPQGQTQADTTGILYAPKTLKPTNYGDIVGVHLENNSRKNSKKQIITFGQVFVKGDLPKNSNLVAITNDNELSTQIDVKTRYDDLSVKWGILSIEIPTIKANSSLDVMLAQRTKTEQVKPILNPKDFTTNGYDTKIKFTFHNTNEKDTIKTIDLAQILNNSLSNNKVETWLSGPLTSDVKINSNINSSFRLLLNVRGYADKTFVTDVQVLNDNIYSNDAKTYNYDVVITSHDEILYSKNNITHHPMQEWHKNIWNKANGTGLAPNIHIAYDVKYLIKTGVIPNYDISLGVQSSQIIKDLNIIAKNSGSPLTNAEITKYQPQTGGRGDIGLITLWEANWLVSQNEQAKNVMLANADASGPSPYHAINPDGSMITIDNNPDLWLGDSRNGSIIKPTIDFATITKNTGWTLDVSHIPDLSYLTALTQSSQYYLRQLQAQANYDLMSLDPGYRGGNAGITYGR